MAKLQFRRSVRFGLLLNLLLPGLGHVYWHDYLFGIFIFLVMLIAAALFFVSFLVSLPVAVYWILLTLPLIFYLFTFVDLSRSIKRRRPNTAFGTSRWAIFLGLGVVYQVLSPSAPVNFAIRNHPSVYRVTDNQFNPEFKKGEYVWSSRLAYSADLFFLNRPLYYRLPDRFDVISYRDTTGATKFGMVIGLPGEEVQVVGGVVIVNGAPQMESGQPELLVRGDWPLTSVERYSILVASLYFGGIEQAREVSLDADIGKLSPLP